MKFFAKKLEKLTLFCNTRAG